MHRNLALAVLAAATLTACGNKTDANEKNFSMAISQYLDKKGELCLELNNWPVDVSEMDLNMQKDRPTDKAGKMEALAAAGLVFGADTEVDEIDMFGNKPTG
jgi:hypothetical protein